MGSCDPLKLGMAGLLLALQLDLRVAARRTNVVRRYFSTLTAMGRVQKEHERTGSFSRMLMQASAPLAKWLCTPLRRGPDAVNRRCNGPNICSQALPNDGHSYGCARAAFGWSAGRLHPPREGNKQLQFRLAGFRGCPHSRADR